MEITDLHPTPLRPARRTWPRRGMTNVGRLARERHPGEVVLVGFAGRRGTVVAAEPWGAPARRFPVPPARAGSAEDRLHRALGDQASLLVFSPAETSALRRVRAEPVDDRELETAPTGE